MAPAVGIWRWTGAGAAIWVGGLAAIALVLIHSVPGDRWMLRVTIAAAAGITCATLAAPLAAVVAVALLLADWVGRGAPPFPPLPEPGPGSTWPVAVLAVVTAWIASSGSHPIATGVLAALTLSLPVLSRAGGGALDRGAVRLGHIVGAAVGAVVFTALGVLTVALPWALHRLTGSDPLASTGWIPRRRGPVHVARPWTDDAALPRTSSGHPIRRTTIAVAALVAVVVAVPPLREGITARLSGNELARVPFRLGQNLDDPTPPEFEIRDAVDPSVKAFTPDPNGILTAMADSTWFTEEAEYATAQGWALQPEGAWRSINPYRLLDFRSAVLNVVNGSRLTWRPPECGCDRLRVWIYGGSTTYGLNQRDEHTIASYIARAAHRDGLTVDVDNRGANGHLHWMEAERFAWDLTVEEPPDMVLFYDGVNESWSGGALNYERSGDIRPMIDPTTVDQWRNAGRSAGPVPPGPPGSRLIGRPDDISLSIEDLAEVTVDRYDRSRDLSRTAADAYGVPVRYFWQPSRLSRPLVMAEPHGNADDENRNRLSEQLMVAALPDDVIDLTGVLRVTRKPLFTDDVHHNEEGARLIGEAIYGKIEANLRDLAGRRTGS